MSFFLCSKWLYILNTFDFDKALACAAGGAIGNASGDVAGQVVTNVRQGESLKVAVSNVNFDNTLDKAKVGAVTGVIGGVVGVGAGKALDAAANSTKAVVGIMSNNINQTAKVLNNMGASAATTQSAINKITTGMGNAAKNTTNNIIKAEATMITESAIKVGEAMQNNKKKQ
jgi:hypothetical protein